MPGCSRVGRAGDTAAWDRARRPTPLRLRRIRSLGVLPERIADGGEGRGEDEFKRIESDPIERPWPASLRRRHRPLARGRRRFFQLAQGRGVAGILQPLRRGPRGLRRAGQFGQGPLTAPDRSARRPGSRRPGRRNTRHRRRETGRGSACSRPASTPAWPTTLRHR